MSKSELITAIVDGVVSTLSIVLAWFLKPEIVNQVMVIAGIWSSIVIALLINHAAERRATLRLK